MGGSYACLNESCNKSDAIEHITEQKQREGFTNRLGMSKFCVPCVGQSTLVAFIYEYLLGEWSKESF